MSEFPTSPSEVLSGDDSEEWRSSSLRDPTVYDAVAGRVGKDGFIISANRHLHKRPIKPEEVLYRQPDAPTRYEEFDYYNAHRNLSSDQQLPDSDLLSAMHAYFSAFYARNEEDGESDTWECMDETALIALGLLMEESAKQFLGATGDLVFLEAGEEGEPQDSDGGTDYSQREMLSSSDEQPLEGPLPGEPSKRISRRNSDSAIQSDSLMDRTADVPAN